MQLFFQYLKANIFIVGLVEIKSKRILGLVDKL